MTLVDYLALALFAGLWAAFSAITGNSRILPRPSLTQLMAERRREWIRNSLLRDLKMIDTQIMAGLQNGTAFFASTSIFAIGGCFALLGASQQAETVFQDLPFVMSGGRTAFELKVCGLTAIFGYSFFKFGWSYRLFNYCTILFGALPMTSEMLDNPAAAERAADRVAQMNIIAASHFNAGLRAIFLSIGYLGWFASAYVFMATSVFVITVLVRRQFFSQARLALMDASLP
ncbi:MAG: DUF599 domain-containing protein [Allorhizobium sp.]